MSNCKRVLYIHGDIMLRGGTEAYMMNYYRHFDHEKLQVDFVVHGFKKGVYDDEIEALGGRIYHVPVKSDDFRGNIAALKKIFSSGEYKLVHAHTDTANYLVLGLAKKCGIPVRISHSHNTAVQSNSALKRGLHNWIKRGIPKKATHLYACSDLAGKWLYGDLPFRLIPNAVNLKRFAYDPILRSQLRQQLGLSEGDIVLGHVGRFNEQKNHGFFVELMRKLAEADKRFKLVLIGEGPLKQGIQDQMNAYGLHERVRFVDACSNVNEYYSIFDYFCLPSLFEGLPVVGVEAQVNGLKCVVADTVSKTLDMTGNVVFLPIDADGIQNWCEYLLNDDNMGRDGNAGEKMRDAGYDINHTSAVLQETYLRLIQEAEAAQAL